MIQGYEIIERNWRTRYCEIDIIARRDHVYYFVEVKYRSSAKQGGGLAAITAKKLRQMSFAAQLYAVRNLEARHMLLEVATVDAVGAIELIEIS